MHCRNYDKVNISGIIYHYSYIKSFMHPAKFFVGVGYSIREDVMITNYTQPGLVLSQ